MWPEHFLTDFVRFNQIEQLVCVWDRERESMCTVGSYKLIHFKVLYVLPWSAQLSGEPQQEKRLSIHLYPDTPSTPCPVFTRLYWQSDHSSGASSFTSVFKNSSTVPLFSSTIRCWALFESLSVHPQNGLTHKGELALEKKKHTA